MPARSQRYRGSVRRRTANSRRQLALPAAYQSVYTSNSYLMTRRSVTNLVVNEVFPIETTETNGFSWVLPICPTKWINTRASVLAGTYSSHRPIRIRVTWMPAVGTTATGSVSFGTVFDGARVSYNTANDLHTLLPATPGGFLTSAWCPKSTFIPLGKNLRANTFPMYEVSDDDIPLWLLLHLDNANIKGVIKISAEFSLHNPINNIATPAAAGSVTLTATNADNSTSATFTSNQSYSVGDMLSFAPWKNVLNTAGAVVTNALGTLIGKVTKQAGNQYTVALSNDIGTQNFIASMIGRAANFI